MSEKKITKKDMYNGIIATLTENFGDEVQDYVTFLQGEIDILDNRAAKEKARRAEKKAEADALKDAVKDTVYKADGAITAQAIADELAEEFEDVTKAKVTYRATQLVKEGEIYKTQIKIDGRKVVAYASEPDGCTE
jgi:hypothetical protein